MMQTKTIENAIKKSIVYSYALTQPFSIYSTTIPSIHAEQDSSIGEAEYGEEGELIRHFQLKLKKLGHYDGNIDGKYGLLTEHAVRQFQSAETIEIDGIMDERTIKKLIHSEEETEIIKLKPLLETVYFGDRNESVRKIQEVLFYYNYYSGEIDGIYGPLTEEAIQKITKKYLQKEKTNSTSLSSVEVISDLDQQKGKVDEGNLQEKSETNISKTREDAPKLMEVLKNNDHIITLAKSFVGTPYVWGGTTPSGFDCSGFIHYIYNEQGIVIPRTVNDIWNFATEVNAPAIGDLIFFETYQPGPSHLGIYLGDGDFIHVSSSNGVEVSNYYKSNYWKSRFLGMKRI